MILNKYHKKIISYLMGIPLFFDLNCLNIYPLCQSNNNRFSLIFHAVLPLCLLVIYRLVKKIPPSINTINLIILLSIYILIIILLRWNDIEISLFLIILQVSIIFLIFFDFQDIIIDMSHINILSEIVNGAIIIGSLSSIIAYIYTLNKIENASSIIYGYFNYWNDYLIILLSVSIYLNYIENKKVIINKKLFLAIFLIFICIILSGSRASLIFFIFVIYGIKKFINLKYLLICTIVGFIFAYAYVDRFKDKIKQIVSDDYDSGRFNIWSSGIDKIDNIFIGSNAGTISSYHSTWIQFLLEGGLITFFITSLIILYGVNRFKGILFTHFIGFFTLGLCLGPMLFNMPLRQAHIASTLIIFYIFVRNVNFKLNDNKLR
jgi:hypothetical protein